MADVPAVRLVYRRRTAHVPGMVAIAISFLNRLKVDARLALQ